LVVFIVAIVLIVIAVGGYGGRRAYKNRGGGSGDNPKSHRGHASKSGANHRGRGKGHH
jgi:hypothetical protein